MYAVLNLLLYNTLCTNTKHKQSLVVIVGVGPGHILFMASRGRGRGSNEENHVSASRLAYSTAAGTHLWTYPSLWMASMASTISQE